MPSNTVPATNRLHPPHNRRIRVFRSRKKKDRPKERQLASRISDFLGSPQKNSLSLPVATSEGLQRHLECSFNTLGRMNLPRRPLYPGCRRYVYLIDDVLEYFRTQPAVNSVIDDPFN